MASLEEELFAHVACELRRLKPYRKYLTPILETTLSPLANAQLAGEGESLRAGHLEIVVALAAEHDEPELQTPLALSLYWTLYTGVLAHWAGDRSPKQEDTLALLDESLAMLVGWLNRNRPSLRPSAGAVHPVSRTQST